MNVTQVLSLVNSTKISNIKAQMQLILPSLSLFPIKPIIHSFISQFPKPKPSCDFIEKFLDNLNKYHSLNKMKVHHLRHDCLN